MVPRAQLGVITLAGIETLLEVVFPLHLFQCRQRPKTAALLGFSPGRAQGPGITGMADFTQRLDRWRPRCPATPPSLWETPKPGFNGTGPRLGSMAPWLQFAAVLLVSQHAADSTDSHQTALYKERIVCKQQLCTRTYHPWSAGRVCPRPV